MAHIAIVGCGNLARSDDGVGIEVARALMPVFGDAPGVRVLDAGTDGMAVMFAARGCTTLIVVDCCRTGAAPGAIFEAPGEALAAPAAPGHNLHELRWDHALYAGRRMYGAAFPADVTVFLIEGRTMDFGVGLSEEVRAAAQTVAGRIAALVRARLAA